MGIFDYFLGINHWPYGFLFCQSIVKKEVNPVRSGAPRRGTSNGVNKNSIY
jgi:hypothetical protein